MPTVGAEFVALIDLLTAYLLGRKTLLDVEEWLAGIDWDDPAVGQETLNLAGLLELLATEVGEGLRPEVEFWQEAADMVARNAMQPASTLGIPPDSSNDIVVQVQTRDFQEPTVRNETVSRSWSTPPQRVLA